ncbi:MAG: hypothetical protein ABIV63_02270 [Caldimonas sp.]
MRTCVILSLAAVGAVASASAADADPQRPAWAEQQWQAVAKREGLVVSDRVVPATQRGDFDGDGRADLALHVMRVKDRTEGIVILSSARPPVVIGAGRTVGHGGDDFSWMDSWHVEKLGRLPRDVQRRRAVRGGDALVVEKDSAASASIHLVDGMPKWRQRGD